MRFLIDTQILIWYYEGNDILPDKAKAAISKPDNQRLVSIVTLWEMAIKVSVGKLSLSCTLPDFFAQIFGEDISILPISANHVLEITTLPHYHKDPFDRLIIAQAIVEDLEVISSDAQFKNYPVKLLL